MAAILFQILVFWGFFGFPRWFLKEKTNKFLETSSDVGQKTKNSDGKTASFYGLVSLVFLVRVAGWLVGPPTPPLHPPPAHSPTNSPSTLTGSLIDLLTQPLVHLVSHTLSS